MESLLAAYGIVFLAELGDKSMLLVMTMAARYPWRLVVVASLLATAIVMGVAVLFGGVAAAALPSWGVALAAAFLFFAFGIWTLLGPGEEAAEGELLKGGPRRPGVGLIAALTGTLVLAELGDKTQIAVLSLAGLNPSERLLVWAGAAGGMFTVQALAIGLGARVTRYLPAEVLGRIAGAVFVAFGLVALLIAIGELT